MYEDRWRDLLSAPAGASDAGVSLNETTSSNENPVSYVGHQMPIMADLDIAWHQRAPFNDACPLASEGEGRCVAGCVAIAVSQILCHHRHPSEATVTEEDAYYVGTTKHTPPSQQTYAFPVLTDESDNTTWKLEELVLCAGILSQTQYSATESLAHAFNAHASLTNDWRYRPSITDYAVTIEDRPADALTTLRNLSDALHLDMDADRPALLCLAGQMANASGEWRAAKHAVVCDGRRRDERTMNEYDYHLRWGYLDATGAEETRCWYALPTFSYLSGAANLPASDVPPIAVLEGVFSIEPASSSAGAPYWSPTEWVTMGTPPNRRA